MSIHVHRATPAAGDGLAFNAFLILLAVVAAAPLALVLYQVFVILAR
jgi:hypothetical protein